MEACHLNQKQLASRWDVRDGTLERWRSDGIGPPFMKLMGRVMYRLQDIEKFELASLHSSTSSRYRPGEVSPCI
jgi:hypothetical protein